MKRPRNNQRARARRAGSSLKKHSAHLLFHDLADLRDYVEAIVMSDLFTNLLGRAGISEDIDLRIGDGRGRSTSTLAQPSPGRPFWELKFPRGTRGVVNVCTLIPWLIAYKCKTWAYDGPQVVGLRYRLVKRFMGTDAALAYQRALAKEGVDRTSRYDWPGGGTGRVQRVSLRHYRKPAKSRRSGRADGEPRDSQKARLYRAESGWKKSDSGRRFSSMNEVRAFVREVESSRMWCELAAGVGEHRPVTVKDGRGGKTSRAHVHGGWTIHIHSKQRNERVVLHEMAHLVTPVRFAAHGPQFVGHFIPDPALAA